MKEEKEEEEEEEGGKKKEIKDSAKIKKENIPNLFFTVQL